MRPTHLIALGAGLVSALLFASVATGSLLAVALLYVSPLPLLIAGLGWGWLAAGGAGLAGSALLLVSLGLAPGLVYFSALALPAATLCYLALLSRPVPEAAGADTSALDWYPPGRLMAWGTVMAGALTGAFVLLVGIDEAQLQATILRAVEDIFKELGPRAPQNLDKEALAQLAAFLARAAPAASAVAWLLIMLLNMLAAGRIVETSGRALRPWPDIQAMTYPGGFSIAAALAFFATLIPGNLGTIATAFAGAFVLAYLLLGLVIIHAITRGSPFRSFLLATLYLAILFLGWVALLVALFGLCDPIFKLRHRASTPPASPGG